MSERITVPHENPTTEDECMDNLVELLQQGPAVSHAEACAGREQGLDECTCWVRSFAAARKHLYQAGRR